MPLFLTPTEYAALEAACERLMPADAALGAPGARAAGIADYIDTLLGAFSFDPPHIWAGGPDRSGFGEFIVLSPLEELAWRTRIEGSRGRPERELNGPVIGLQERYRDGLRQLGDDFADATPDVQDARLDALTDFKRLVYAHACEGMYGDPVYGGNRDRLGWRFAGFEGDAQPRGYTDSEVSGP